MALEVLNWFSKDQRVVSSIVHCSRSTLNSEVTFWRNTIHPAGCACQGVLEYTGYRSWIGGSQKGKNVHTQIYLLPISRRVLSFQQAICMRDLVFRFTSQVPTWFTPATGGSKATPLTGGTAAWWDQTAETKPVTTFRNDVRADVHSVAQP